MQSCCENGFQPALWLANAVGKLTYGHAGTEGTSEQTMVAFVSMSAMWRVDGDTIFTWSLSKATKFGSASLSTRRLAISASRAAGANGLGSCPSVGSTWSKGLICVWAPKPESKRGSRGRPIAKATGGGRKGNDQSVSQYWCWCEALSERLRTGQRHACTDAHGSYMLADVRRMRAATHSVQVLSRCGCADATAESALTPVEAERESASPHQERSRGGTGAV